MVLPPAAVQRCWWSTSCQTVLRLLPRKGVVNPPHVATMLPIALLGAAAVLPIALPYRQTGQYFIGSAKSTIREALSTTAFQRHSKTCCVTPQRLRCSSTCSAATHAKSTSC